MLSGYRTYIVAFLMLLKAVIDYLSGDSQALSAVDWQFVLEALGLAALRKGIASS